MSLYTGQIYTSTRKKIVIFWTAQKFHLSLKDYCHGIRWDCVFLPKYRDSFALKIGMPVCLLSLCMFHARFCCRSSWTVFISYFPQGSICWMLSHTKDHVWIFCCGVVRSSNKESKSCILKKDLLFFFWGEKCVLNTQIVSSSQVLIFQWKWMWEEEEDFNKT